MPNDVEKSIKASEEARENVQYLDVKVLEVEAEGVDTDPFNLNYEEFKKLKGVDDPRFKRKARELSKSFTGANDTGTQQLLIAQAITGYAFFDLIEPPYNLDYLSRIYETSTYNFAAINAKTSNIVGLGYSFLETAKANDALDELSDQTKIDRSRKKISKLKRDLTSWLDSTNKEDTFIEVLKKVWTDKEATGNGYLEIGRDVTGKIGYLGHIPAKTMRVRRERDGFIQLLYGRAVYFKPYGEDFENPISDQDGRPNEVMHFKSYTPNNNYYGIPDIIAALNALVGNEFADRYNLDYFENKAVPRYIITVKGAVLSPTSERKLLEFFQVSLKGKSHRSLYIPLPADSAENKVEFKMEPIEANVQEASFNEYRKSNRDEILIAHRVPLGKIGTPEGVALAAARDSDKTFKEQVCRPAQIGLEKRINMIVSEMTDTVAIKFNELTLTDEKTQAEIDAIYLKNKVVVPNEIRVRQGRVPLDGGDKVIELKPQVAADMKATEGKTRERDDERRSNATDSAGEGRNAKGDGPKVS